MRKISILLVLASLVGAFGFAGGNLPRYSLVQTCTDTNTGEKVALKKCNGNNHRYTLTATCYDNINHVNVDMSLCGVH